MKTIKMTNQDPVMQVSKAVSTYQMSLKERIQLEKEGSSSKELVAMRISMSLEAVLQMRKVFYPKMTSNTFKR